MDESTKIITGNLKPSPGCKDKTIAEKQVIPSTYRFTKYTQIMCQKDSYGWGLDKVMDYGELVCKACEGEYEGNEKYSCYMKDVKVQCTI